MTVRKGAVAYGFFRSVHAIANATTTAVQWCASGRRVGPDWNSGPSRPPAAARSASTLSLAHEIEAYQALLEGHRRDPDDDELAEDLRKARAAMEIAWLERVAA